MTAMRIADRDEFPPPAGDRVRKFDLAVRVADGSGRA
jgi:hypothetical protein